MKTAAGLFAKHVTFQRRILGAALVGLLGFAGCGGSAGKSGGTTPPGGGTNTGPALTIPRGRPHLNSARTTFVAENGQPLRGPYTSSEWGDPAPRDQIAKMKDLGFNALHIYGECFDINYPNAGSTAPGYAAARLDKVVQDTRELGLYLVMTIGNGANNGNNNPRYAVDFWKFYASRYANEAHVIFEIQNEPVAWGPPYGTSTSPAGALDMEVAAYKTIRQYAPASPVLLFSYSVLGGTGGADAALADIHSFNQTVFGDKNAVWDNLAVGFHGYAGAEDTATAVDRILSAGYPMFMTEFSGGIWGVDGGGLDVELTSRLERAGVSWLTFAFVPPWGVSNDVTKPDVYSDRVNRSGLSWTPDFGTWPAARSVHGNNGNPWATPGYTNNALAGTLRIEAEDFDNGGSEIAYHNSNGTNPGGQYRTNGSVGIEATTDNGGGYDVGWNATGDWLEYTIRVSRAGNYDLSVRVAGTTNGDIRFSLGGADITGDWALPNTGGKQTWTTVTKRVFLPQGQQRLRLSFLTGGSSINWFEFAPAASGPLADGAYRIQNMGSKQSLSVDANANVVCGSNQETWNFSHIGGGQYKVTRASNGNAWNTWMGPLHLTGWWGAGDSQCFILIPIGTGNYQIMPSGSGKCLLPSTANAPNLDQAIRANDVAQQWSIF